MDRKLSWQVDLTTGGERVTKREGAQSSALANRLLQQACQVNSDCLLEWWGCFGGVSLHVMARKRV